MPAAYELLSLCFPDARPDLFRRQTEHDSTFRRRHARVVEVDGAVVGYLRIFDRRVWVRGARLRAAGIGSVATHPDYRRRGLATALVRDTLALLRHDGHHLSFLGAEIAAPFYERLGWRIVRQPSHSAPAAEAAAPAGAARAHRAALRALGPGGGGAHPRPRHPRSHRRRRPQPPLLVRPPLVDRRRRGRLPGGDGRPARHRRLRAQPQRTVGEHARRAGRPLSRRRRGVHAAPARRPGPLRREPGAEGHPGLAARGAPPRATPSPGCPRRA